METGGLEEVGFKDLIETCGVRSIKISMSRTRLIGVGLVLILEHVLYFNIMPDARFHVF